MNAYPNDVYQFAETLQTNCTSKRDFSTPTHHFQSELFCLPGRFAPAFPHRNSKQSAGKLNLTREETRCLHRGLVTLVGNSHRWGYASMVVWNDVLKRIQSDLKTIAQGDWIYRCFHLGWKIWCMDSDLKKLAETKNWTK